METARNRVERETARLAALESLGAVRSEADRALQEIVDDVRGLFGTDLCMVNLILADVQYFRAWSGDLPADLAEARQDPRERSMCRYVVETEMPLVVEDFLATEKFKEQHFCVNYGIRFYAGTPLMTSDGNVVGSLCLLHTSPREFSEKEEILLTAFARAVIGRLELLGALGRERGAKEELRYRAFHDSLTGLPNRALLINRIEHALERAERDGNTAAVLFLDLDDFKVVNDSLGHETGDELLVAFAKLLRGCLRPGDTAARLGGDEFVVLLEDGAGEAEAAEVADRIGDALRTPFQLGSCEVYAEVSIGISLTLPGLGAEDLLRHADIAMYQAKVGGKARHRLFEPAMNARATRRLVAKNRLRRAIEGGELVVHYQPIVSLGSGEVVGMEALVRWADPERGLVLPAEFIPLAEETGLIVPMGKRVLREACRQAAEWHHEHPAISPVAVWVNLSPRQFHGTDVIGQVSSVLEETGLDPRCLGLEITEGVVMDDAESTIETLRYLKKLGVRLAIDDFGKGYSSLNYVKRFPVDCLKIDRSFVCGIREHPEDLAIARTVVALGHALGMEVVAEGVEQVEQLDVLRGLGCDYGQGYHFARPMLGEEASALLAARADSGSTSAPASRGWRAGEERTRRIRPSHQPPARDARRP